MCEAMKSILELEREIRDFLSIYFISTMDAISADPQDSYQQLHCHGLGLCYGSLPQPSARDQ